MSDDTNPTPSENPDQAGADAAEKGDDALSGEELAVLERRIDEWIGELDAQYDHIVAVDRDEDGATRWYVRMAGDEKDYTTVWLSLGQRMLRYEAYVMPAPEENHQLLYENLLRRNDRMIGVHFSIGGEDGVYLRGALPTGHVDKADIDRILGTVYATVEQTFVSLLRIGFATRFAEG